MQKETIQIISSVIQDGVLNGDFSAITNWDVLSPSSPLIQLLTNKLNARPCPRGENIAPCNFNWVNVYPALDDHSARWVLPNGVQLGLQPQSVYLTGNSLLFTVDVKPENNGRSTWAEVGADQLHLLCNIQENTTVTASAGVYSIVPLKGGQCGGLSNWGNSAAQFNWLYQ